MSQLIIQGATATFALNVTSFDSPMYAQENSAQVKALQVHFPVRMAQPSVKFDVTFANIDDYLSFQQFVRDQQALAINNSQPVSLYWPARNILGWTGFIGSFEAGNTRFNYVPRSSFKVDLVDSLLSYRTYFQSLSAYWTSIYGIDIPGGVLAEPSLSPTQQLEQTGIAFLDSGNVVQIPGVGFLNVGTGIVSGSI